MPKAMIITVGTGKNVEHGICFSIEKQNPDHIIFIVTKESKNKIIPQILENPKVKSKKSEEILLSDENDIEKIYSQCLESIERAKKLGYSPADIVIDYTSGTKSMSAAVVLAGIKKWVGSLSYITGERDSNGRVISSTERSMILEPNKIYADLFFDKGREKGADFSLFRNF